MISRDNYAKQTLLEMLPRNTVKILLATTKQISMIVFMVITILWPLPHSMAPIAPVSLLQQETTEKAWTGSQITYVS